MLSILRMAHVILCVHARVVKCIFEYALIGNRLPNSMIVVVKSSMLNYLKIAHICSSLLLIIIYYFLRRSIIISHPLANYYSNIKHPVLSTSQIIINSFQSSLLPKIHISSKFHNSNIKNYINKLKKFVYPNSMLNTHIVQIKNKLRILSVVQEAP